MIASGTAPGGENPHVAWRMAVARRAAAAYTGNPKLAAFAVAGSVGSGLADRFSDLEIDCYWHEPPQGERGDEIAVQVLLADTVALAERTAGVDLAEFRAALAERRQPHDPPRLRRANPALLVITDAFWWRDAKNAPRGWGGVG